jgi:Fuc2NAc and GlcNAc transferase
MLSFAGKNRYVLLLLSSIFLGWAGTWVISKSTYKVHLLDYPAERSSHEVITPKGGGMGILITFALAALVLDLPFMFVIPATLISLVSFYNDCRHLSVGHRLIIHFLAAVLLILPSLFDTAFISTSNIPLITFFWALFYIFFIVATTNFYNFMDGINGIAGITGVISFGLIALYYNRFLHINTMPDSGYAVLSGCLAFSCLGFLPFNIPKARVFMGDVGSILLGFVFAGVIVKLSRNFLDLTSMASLSFSFLCRCIYYYMGAIPGS